MVTFIASRDALKRRIDAVFGDAFAELYPGVEPPKVFTGFPANEPPFYVAVDEVVDAAAADGGATMGHATLGFTLRVWAFARHASLEAASNALLSYVDAVFAAVMADARLGGTVDNAFPSVESAGTAADSSKRYSAAASIAVECSVWASCSHRIMEVVDDCDG